MTDTKIFMLFQFLFFCTRSAFALILITWTICSCSTKTISTGSSCNHVHSATFREEKKPKFWGWT